MKGRGIYKMFAVKEIKVTENFNNLRQDQKKCQNLESFESCVNNQLLMLMQENCKCLPFELANFTGVDLVTLIENIIISLHLLLEGTNM